MYFSRTAAGLAAVVALAGCGGSDTATPASPSATTATPSAEQSLFDQYVSAAERQGAVARTTYAEFGSVTKNLCDNTEADMTVLVETLRTVETSLAGSIKDTGAAISVACPRQLISYEDAVRAGARPNATKAPKVGLSPQDLDLAVAIVRQKCFGTAGCNVTVQVTPTYNGANETVLLGSYDVTYEIKGGEDTYINTFSLNDGKSNVMQDSVSTKTSDVDLTATVTAVAVT